VKLRLDSGVKLRVQLGSMRPRLVAALVAIVALLVGGWLWVRDSSLVAVQRVAVTGTSGPDAEQIDHALIVAARRMTTLDVSMSELRSAVARYPVIKDLQVGTQFPHGLRIHVIQEVAVATVLIDGRMVAVAPGGRLVSDAAQNASLPTIPLQSTPAGSRLTDPQALAAVALLAAAPSQLLSHLSEVTTVASHGLVAQLRSGPSIYFGDSSRLAAKWTAATDVLADAGSAGASYVDVTDPERPAAGGASVTSTTTSGG
jgi:cell division protein FtsQ